tara:strand:+ start:3313 stop:3582 length:270 start_codon:yes stop_codon:yes gene_type:complete
MNSSRNNTLEFSSAGSIIVDGTGVGDFGAIQVLKDAQITAVVTKTRGQGIVENPTKLHTTFTAGTIIYGSFTSVTITSGLVALHKLTNA